MISHGCSTAAVSIPFLYFSAVSYGVALIAAAGLTDMPRVAMGGKLISAGTVETHPVEPAKLQEPRCWDASYVPYVPGSLPKVQLKSFPAISRCGNPAGSYGEHLLVTTTFNINTSWMAKDIPVPYFVYHAGDSEAEHSHPNVGNEAMGYLMFIAEYYDCLPEVTLFAHPHKSSWHSSGDLDDAIRRVRWQAVPGYAVLHRQGLWWETHVTNISLNLVGRVNHTMDDIAPCHELLNATAYNDNAVYHYFRGEWITKAWDSFFEPAGLGRLPNITRCPIHAEFFVTRERIQAHPRKFYCQAIQWILDSQEQAGLNSYQVGCIFENLWHYIFGEPAQMHGLTVPECELYDCCCWP